MDEERCHMHGEKLATLEERTLSILRICKTNFALYCLTLSIFSGAMLVGCALLDELPDIPVPPPVEEPVVEGAGQVTVESNLWYRQ